MLSEGHCTVRVRTQIVLRGSCSPPRGTKWPAGRSVASVVRVRALSGLMDTLLSGQGRRVD